MGDFPVDVMEDTEGVLRTEAVVTLDVDRAAHDNPPKPSWENSRAHAAVTAEELATDNFPVDLAEDPERRLFEAEAVAMVLTALDVDKSTQDNPPKPSWDSCRAHGAVAAELIGEGAGRARTPERRIEAVKNVCMVASFGSE